MIGAFIAKEKELLTAVQTVQKHYIYNVRPKLDVYFQKQVLNLLVKIGYALIVKILLSVLYVIK
jgi:hypothetical protein